MLAVGRSAVIDGTGVASLTAPTMWTHNTLRLSVLVLALHGASVARAQPAAPEGQPDAAAPEGQPDAAAPEGQPVSDADGTTKPPPEPLPTPGESGPTSGDEQPQPATDEGTGATKKPSSAPPPAHLAVADEAGTPSESSDGEPATAAAPTDPYESVREFSLNAADADVRVKPVAEVGAVFVLWHRYQGGSDGTDFNWRRDGGQGSASFTWRVSAELELLQHHQLILLYQPVDLRTRATLTEDLRVNGLTFPSGTAMQFRYGFDFYRLSYLYDFVADPHQELALGLSLQLRVADIEFASLDGTLQRTSQNLGPVPLVKLRGRYTFDNDAFIGTELDGIGIEFPSEQGSVLGLFFDTSLRVGYSPTNFLETFFNLRYFGGGARGPGSKTLSPEFGDGYNNNFIHTFTTSVGFAVK